MPQPSRDVLVLMTATVKPAILSGTAAPDPAPRLAEYKAAVTAHARAIAGMRGVRLVLAENSGWGREELADHCAAVGAELLCDAADPEAAAYAARAKGAAELRLIMRAMADPRLAGAPVVLKLTGRLVLANLAAWVTDIGQSRSDLYCRLRLPRDYADSRAVAFTPAGLAVIESFGGEIDDARGFYLEHVLARTCRVAADHGLTWSFPRHYPRFEGYSGAAGTRYEENALRRVMSEARFHTLRTIHAARSLARG